MTWRSIFRWSRPSTQDPSGEGEAELEALDDSDRGGGALPGIAGSEGAEAAEADLASFEPPTDLAP